MRTLLIITSAFVCINCFGQQEQTNDLMQSMKRFHKALVDNDTLVIKKMTAEDLTYGHSNGWIQSRAEVINDANNGTLTYSKFVEDSIDIKLSKGVACARFIADIDAALKGKAGRFHLKVLEIWIRQKDNWKLFARQAVKG